jgi:hypothetical protein
MPTMPTMTLNEYSNIYIQNRYQKFNLLNNTNNKIRKSAFIIIFYFIFKKVSLLILNIYL